MRTETFCKNKSISSEAAQAHVATRTGGPSTEKLFCARTPCAVTVRAEGATHTARARVKEERLQPRTWTTSFRTVETRRCSGIRSTTNPCALGATVLRRLER